MKKDKSVKRSEFALFMDTSDFDWIRFGLINLQTCKTAAQKFRIGHFDSEKTLPSLQQFLHRQNIKITGSSIKKIFFVSGPGSFSGIRVGASIALALGFAWDAPVFALKKNKLPKNPSALLQMKLPQVGADPQLDYGQPPKITKEKKKDLRHTGRSDLNRNRS